MSLAHTSWSILGAPSQRWGSIVAPPELWHVISHWPAAGNGATATAATAETAAASAEATAAAEGV